MANSLRSKVSPHGRLLHKQSRVRELTEALVKGVPEEHIWSQPTEVSKIQLIISCLPSSTLNDLEAYTEP